jgi:hypothetical protein
MKARDNPFATSRVLRIRYQLRGVSWTQLLARLEALRYRAAIVGPNGSGKTTLLEDLEPHLRARGFRVHRLRLDARNRSSPPGYLAGWFGGMGAQDCVLFDGAEQMGWWRWFRCKRLARGAGGLIITSHRPGLLPTVWECRTNPELLAGILGHLLSRPAAEIAVMAAPLHHRHGGNLREVLRELYDRHAPLESHLATTTVELR